VPLAE